MRLLTISNLFPRPDRQTLGMFNAQLFREVARLVSVRNVCLVPEWRFWRRQSIRKWHAPDGVGVATRYEPVLHLPLMGRSLAAESYASSLSGRVGELGDVDAVLAAWLYPDGVAVSRLAKEAGVPAWVLVQGSDTFHLGNARRKSAILECGKHVAGFICVCRMLADRLVDAGLPAEKVHVVLNGVDTKLFRPYSRTECEARLSQATGRQFSGTDRKRLLFVGNLVPVKGPDVALRAFEALVRTGPGVSAELIVVGDGEMRRDMESFVRSRNLGSDVTFVGARSHVEIVDWMNVADVLVLSSRSEGMPNVVLEALACGLPVAATDAGACGEMLRGEPCARVVPVGNATGLAAAIRELLLKGCERPELAARHGRRTWADMAREIVDNMAKRLSSELRKT